MEVGVGLAKILKALLRLQMVNVFRADQVVGVIHLNVLVKINRNVPDLIQRIHMLFVRQHVTCTVVSQQVLDITHELFGFGFLVQQIRDVSLKPAICAYTDKKFVKAVLLHRLEQLAAKRRQIVFPQVSLAAFVYAPLLCQLGGLPGTEELLVWDISQRFVHQHAILLLLRVMQPDAQLLIPIVVANVIGHGSFLKRLARGCERRLNISRTGGKTGARSRGPGSCWSRACGMR